MSDPFHSERVTIGVGHSLVHAMGRIEGVLEGIREDMKAAAEAQQALLKKVEASNVRIEALETWRENLGRDEKDRKDRNRAIGTVSLVLLVPAMTWAAETSRWIYDLVHRVQPADTHPKPPTRLRP
jgi:hypothetical protein